MAKKQLSRRDFLKAAATSGAGVVLSSAPVLVNPVMAQDVVEIELMAWGNPTEFEAREATLGLFHETQSEIKVNFTHVPDQYGTKLQTRLAGGDFPDVFFAGNGDIVPHVSRNLLASLDERIEADSFDTSDIFPGNLDLYNMDGVQYGFPVDAPNHAIFYNKTLFDEAGIDVPSSDWTDESWNWDAFLERAIALTDRDNNQWGWQVKTGFRPIWIWITANGGGFFNEEGTEVIINQEPTVEALQFLADLIHVHQVAPTTDVATEMGGGELFQSGITAMESWWPAIGRMRTNIADKFEWDVAPPPAGAAGKTTVGGGTGHVISSSAPHPEEAWTLMKFLIDPETVAVWTDIMGIVPPLQSVAEGPAFLKPDEPPEHINVFIEGNQGYLKPDPRHPSFSQAQSMFQSGVERLWLGEADAQTILDDVAAQINRIL